MPSLTTTPTISELLNASNWEYQKTGLPADLTPFMAHGQALSFTDQQAGISAHVWQTPNHQLVISYEGTQAISFSAALLDPAFSFKQVIEDTGVAQGTITAGEKEAAAFARHVIAVAGKQGYAAGGVFVTGHSLGAIQAEYAAERTGLGGVGFESTGLPRLANGKAAGDGQNFVNVVQYGDPVANYASDIAAEQPFAPRYSEGSSGALPHYGYVAMIGDPAAQQSLKDAGSLSALPSPIGVGLTTAAYGVGLAAYHVPNVQAYNLGVELTQYGGSEVSGIRSGPVLDAANFGIGDLISATNASYAAPLPKADHVSPTHGHDAGAAAALLNDSADFAGDTHLSETTTLVDLLLPSGGLGSPDPGAVDLALSQIFMNAESDVAGTLSRAIDRLAHGGMGGSHDLSPFAGQLSWHSEPHYALF